jgi:hypothetical protein
MTTLTTRDEVFLYQVAENDAWLVTLRGDFAEMLRIDPSESISKYERYEAPLEKVREAVRELRAEGYTLCYSLNLNIKRLVEV